MTILIKEWHFKRGPTDGTLVWLLTIMGVAIAGHWTGKEGEYYSAWAEINDKS